MHPYEKINAETEGADETSVLSYYKKLIALRKSSKVVSEGDITFLEKCKQNPNAELLWASCREFYNIMEAEECGCQIITVQNSILAKSKNYGKDLEEYSLETVRGFFKDASGLGFSIL